MKKLTTVFLALFMAFNIYAQSEVMDAIAFVEEGSDRIGFYDFSTGELHQFVWQAGTFLNDLYYYQDRIFVVSSGDFTLGDTKLIIIPTAAFEQYQANSDSTVFDAMSTVVPLEQYGNGWSVTGLTDSTVLVTLAAANKLAIVNFYSGEIVSTIDNINGNPQGACQLNENYVAVAVADWGYGLAGDYVAFVNKNTYEIDDTLQLRKNVSEVTQLSDGNILATTWGTWFGEDNYGTVSLINPDSLNVIKTFYPADSSKVYNMVQLDERYVHFNGYDRNFATVTSVLDLQTLEDSTITDGFWAKEIVANINNTIFVKDSIGVNLYNPAGDSIGTLPYFHPYVMEGFKYNAVGVEENNIYSATNFKLSQNYPNPFNPSTTIEYTIPQTESGLLDVSLKVYDILGREITSLVNAKQTAGNYTVRFNAENLPSGIYFYTLKAGNFSTTKKMILMK